MESLKLLLFPHLSVSLAGGGTGRVSSFNTVQTHARTTTANPGVSLEKRSPSEENPRGLPRRHGDNNLSIETAVLLLSNTRYRRRIIVIRPRKSSSDRRAAYKPGPRTDTRVMANCAIQMMLNKRSSEVLKKSRKSRRSIDKEKKGKTPVLLYVLQKKGKTFLGSGAPPHVLQG